MIDELQERTRNAESAIDEQLSTYEEENLIDLVSLLQTLYKGRKKIFVATLVGSIIAASSAFLIAPRYTSKASFIPPSTNNSSTAAALAGQLSPFASLGAGTLMGGLKSPSDLYVGILKSRRVASELVKRFDLKNVYRVKKDSAAQKLLASNTSFDIGIKDSIVTISVTDKSPERARDMANAYLDLLREANGSLALTESSQRRLFFGQQLLKEKDALEAAEVDLKKTEETSGFVAPATQTAAEIQMIANTRAQIAVRQVELSALRQSATEQNPDVIRLQSEIRDLEGQLTHFQSGTGKSGAGDLPTSKLPGMALDYVRKSREVKYHEALFEMLSRLYEAARIDEAREAPLLQILDTASYPDAKSFPSRVLIIIGGIILGFMIGVSLVLLQGRFPAFFQSIKSNI